MRALLVLSAGVAAAAAPSSIAGNFVYRPPPGVAPRACVHFLGGAFVGAAPQLAYAQLLETIAEAGHLVVATPFELELDYLALCEAVLCKAEPAHAALLAEYGELPFVGMGHSAGALLQVLLSSVFRGTGGLADTERASNVLISFNNKRAADAIPFFAEVFAPAASSVVRLDEEPLLQPATATLRRVASTIRDALEGAALDASTPPVASEAINLATQFLPLLDQLEPLLREISDGVVEFSPPPQDTSRAAAQLYRARRSLVLRFDDDSLDESLPLPTLLQGGGDVQLASLAGTHVTPLAPPTILGAPLPLPLPAAASLAGARQADFEALCGTILGFLDESLEPLTASTSRAG